MSEEFEDRIRRSVEGVPVPEPAPMEQVTRHARRIRVRRWVSGAVTAAVVVGAGIGVPVGLLSSLNGGPAGAPTVVGSAAATGPLPDVADIVCDGTTTQVLTPQVKPQPDGVHFRVDNTSGQDLAIQFGKGDFFSFGGDNAFQGSHEIDFHDVPPGEAKVRCLDAEKDAGSDEGFVPLEIVDQDGVWASETLQCPADVTSVQVLIAEGVEGYKGDPIDAARERYASLIRPSDELRPVGYPEGSEPKVALIRDGDVRAVFDFISDGADGWLSPSYSGCVYPDD
jgi:hypothetical protein